MAFLALWIAVFLMTCAHSIGQPEPELKAGRMPLGDVASRYGLPAPAAGGTTNVIRGDAFALTLEVNSRKLSLNGTLIWLNVPLEVDQDEQPGLARVDVETVLDPLLAPDRFLRGTTVKTVVLDPGHGGSDAGAIGTRKVYEKKVVLDVAKRAARKLHAADVAAKLTHTRDHDLSLGARTRKAADLRASLLVSVHVNSAQNVEAAGVETYVLAPPGFQSTNGGNSTPPLPYPGNRNDGLNTLLAYDLHRAILAKTGQQDRGIKHARFDVLRNAPCPAVLIECGFVSNPAEQERMISAEFRDAVAEGIARGILAYRARIPAASRSAP